jgi:ubiquinone/menaquinone biosynthesis C-methylase UbiE
MMSLNIESDKFDLVVHSDTLEHISNPTKALAECHRVLKKDGLCIFTVPIIVDRMSRSRDGLEKSFHGSQELRSPDQLVYTEFGSDVWNYVIQSGFSSCEFYSYDYPAGIAIIARK